MLQGARGQTPRSPHHLRIARVARRLCARIEGELQGGESLIGERPKTPGRSVRRPTRRRCGLLPRSLIRIVNTRLSGGGKSSGGGNQNSADWNVSIANPADLLTSINFARYSNSNNTRVTWEIIEYVGALGGPNEFIVRTQDQIENTAQAATGAAVGSIGCRTAPHATAAYIGQRFPHDTPVWLRLEYLGDGASFNYYWSEDPVANGWTLINDPAWDTEGKVTSPTLLDVPLTDTIYVGLAVTSHNTGQQTTIDFDNLAGFGFGEPTTVNNVTGEGTIAGDVLIAGSLAPGSSIGEITVLGDLALDAGDVRPASGAGSSGAARSRPPTTRHAAQTPVGTQAPGAMLAVAKACARRLARRAMMPWGFGSQNMVTLRADHATRRAVSPCE